MASIRSSWPRLLATRSQLDLYLLPSSPRPSLPNFMRPDLDLLMRALQDDLDLQDDPRYAAMFLSLSSSLRHRQRLNTALWRPAAIPLSRPYPSMPPNSPSSVTPSVSPSQPRPSSASLLPASSLHLVSSALQNCPAPSTLPAIYSKSSMSKPSSTSSPFKPKPTRKSSLAAFTLSRSLFLLPPRCPPRPTPPGHPFGLTALSTAPPAAALSLSCPTMLPPPLVPSACLLLAPSALLSPYPACWPGP